MADKDIDLKLILTAELRQNDFGTVEVQLRSSNRNRNVRIHERKIAALIYGLVAELELRCEAAGLGFAISPEAIDFRFRIEIGEHDDPALAWQLAEGVLNDFGLPRSTVQR